MIKPFRQADLTSHQRKILNYRLSRVRRVLEEAFGIMTSQFRIFYTDLNLEPENIDIVVKATCALHTQKSFMHLKNVSIEKILKTGL